MSLRDILSCAMMHVSAAAQWVAGVPTGSCACFCSQQKESAALIVNNLINTWMHSKFLGEVDKSAH